MGRECMGRKSMGAFRGHNTDYPKGKEGSGGNDLGAGSILRADLSYYREF